MAFYQSASAVELLISTRIGGVDTQTLIAVIEFD